MIAEAAGASCSWLCTGREVFPAMLRAIDGAQQSVLLETYIYAPGSLGERFREALVRARKRGAQVKVLIDALGSYNLPAEFWAPLLEVGAEVRWFNPIALNRLGIRNHRKVLVCDEEIAFVGGFNIAPEYEGDGVTCGWCDLGLQVEGPLAAQLAVSFHEMFARADLRHKILAPLRRSTAKRTVVSAREQILLSGPGRGDNPIKRALRQDLAQAHSVQIMVAYFLPTWRLRRQLVRVARLGGRVQLILAGKSDVTVSRLAAQRLYRGLLNAGIQIYEYQPQVLHAKLILIDDVIYVGSANLDPRSLYINYELMLRFQNAQMAVQGRQIFEQTLQHCQPVTVETCRLGASLWNRLKQYWAYYLLVRLDPYIARRQWQGLLAGATIAPSEESPAPLLLRSKGL